MRIGIDLMGSDTAPQQLFKGVIEAIPQLPPKAQCVVLATQEVISQLKPHSNSAIKFHPVCSEIKMDEEPLHAIKKRDASLVVGVSLLKQGQLDAFVSAGNTGALVAASTLYLPRLPGIKRPALLVELPTRKGPLAVLDVGGNVACTAQHLVQFAEMGAAYQRRVHQCDVPAVGLLNIGVEPCKGTEAIKKAYVQLKERSEIEAGSFRFIGNIEAREIFSGAADVLVTDGFTGNVLLKSAEGIASFILEALEEEPSGAAAKNITAIRQRFSYTEYPGALVCGVEGIVIKCHGNATSSTFLRSILWAAGLLQDTKGHQDIESV